MVRRSDIIKALFGMLRNSDFILEARRSQLRTQMSKVTR